MTKNHERTEQSGLTLIEITVTFTLLAIGLMGFVGSIVSAQYLARATREMDIAHRTMVNIVESFREEAATDFGATMLAYDGGKVIPLPQELGANANVTATLIRDENAIFPYIDLNKSGTIDTTPIALDMLHAAVLRIELEWNGVIGDRRLEYTTVLARGEL
ncbi:MAG: hypothetical protein ACE5F1_05725 [Planctomycetota bacterium]